MRETRETEGGLPPLSELIACPVCDALHRRVPVPTDGRARCRRCHAILMAPRSGAITQVAVLSLTALILMAAAVFFPFLDLRAGGFERKSSLFDAILAFSDGLLLPLSFAVAALIVVLPALRFLAIAYALVPLALSRPPGPHAMRAFRLAQALKPWSMAEIFVVGVAVALVKVGGLATISPGPAFWAFAVLVLVIVLKDNFMCRLTIWNTLDGTDRS